MRPALVGALLIASVVASGSAAAAQTRVDTEYHVDAYGIRVGAELGFDSPTTVSSPRVSAGDETVAGSLWPTDGTDPDVGPSQVLVRGGGSVLVEGLLTPTCGAGGSSVLSVRVRTGGSEAVERYAPADPDGYGDALAAWCARPVTATVTGSAESPDGTLAVHLDLSNPGPDPVTVKVGALATPTSSWDAATIVVDGGTVGHLTAHGRGDDLCGGAAPWTDGNLRADGRALVPQAGSLC